MVLIFTKIMEYLNDLKKLINLIFTKIKYLNDLKNYLINFRRVSIKNFDNKYFFTIFLIMILKNSIFT